MFSDFAFKIFQESIEKISSTECIPAGLESISEDEIAHSVIS